MAFSKVWIFGSGRWFTNGSVVRNLSRESRAPSSLSSFKDDTWVAALSEPRLTREHKIPYRIQAMINNPLGSSSVAPKAFTGVTKGNYKIGPPATWNKALFRLAQQVVHLMAWIGKTASTTAWPDGEEAHHTAPSEPNDWGRKDWRKSPWR